MRTVAGLTFAFAVLASPAAGWAAQAWPDLDRSSVSGDRFGQRTDVDEVLLPPEPHGPATPSPFCAPSAPFCP
jgi:hypothetical protein